MGSETPRSRGTLEQTFGPDPQSVELAGFDLVDQQGVEDLIISNGAVSGVVTAMGLEFHARAVVLTVGTFLHGKIHVGLSHSYRLVRSQANLKPVFRFYLQVAYIEFNRL